MNAPAAVSPVRAAAALVPGFAATAAAHDRSGRFPRGNIAALHAAGLLTLSVPRRFGGTACGLAPAAAVIAAIAQGEPATALVLTMQTNQHAGLARAQTWPEHLHERVARDAVEHGALINALRVEPELGTPARGGLPATIARRVSEGWRLSGRKIFCTGIPVLSWLAVWARTDEAQPRVGMFLVPAGAPGIAVEESWDQLGLRASESHDVIFTDVALPADHAVDVRAPEAWAGPDPQAGAWNAVLIGALYHGIALGARDWLGRWLHARVPANLGAPLASVPRIQSEFGEIDGMLRLDARLLRGFAEAVDAGDMPPPGEAGLLKQRLTANAIAAVQRALALTGNAGLARRNPLERHLRDVLCGPVHTPQDDSVFLAAGRAALAEFKGAQP